MSRVSKENLAMEEESVQCYLDDQLSHVTNVIIMVKILPDLTR